MKRRTRIEVLGVRCCCSQAALGRTKQRFSMGLCPVPGVPCSTTSTLHTKPCPGLGFLLEGAGVQPERFNFKICALLLMEMMDHSIRVGITVHVAFLFSNEIIWINWLYKTFLHHLNHPTTEVTLLESTKLALPWDPAE